MRRLVRKLEQRGIAGVCIEDKQFPKTNSFLNGERQPLAEVAEFAGKIAAGKDTQHDPDFCIVARVEALIAGWGMDEALRRAEAYRHAGADAILIHSKLSKPDEIVTFAREWAGRAPLVIVPTKYYSTPTDVFRKAGISMVIWANHLVRAATAAMQSVAKEIHTNETLVNVADAIDTSGIKLVVNERHAETSELASLACAVDALESDTIISYGDLLFRSYVLRDLVDSQAEFSVVVDSSPTAASNRTVRDFAYCSRSDDRGLFGTPVVLRQVISGKQAAARDNGESASGRWIGLLSVSRAGLVKLKAVLGKLRKRPDFDTLDMPALMNALIADGARIEVLYVHGHWRGVNDLEDFRQAVDFAHAQTPLGSSAGNGKGHAQ
jgi:choline kinase